MVTDTASQRYTLFSSRRRQLIVKLKMFQERPSGRGLCLSKTRILDPQHSAVRALGSLQLNRVCGYGKLWVLVCWCNHSRQLRIPVKSLELGSIDSSERHLHGLRKLNLRKVCLGHGFVLLPLVIIKTANHARIWRFYCLAERVAADLGPSALVNPIICTRVDILPVNEISR